MFSPEPFHYTDHITIFDNHLSRILDILYKVMLLQVRLSEVFIIMHTHSHPNISSYGLAVKTKKEKPLENTAIIN